MSNEQLTRITGMFTDEEDESTSAHHKLTSSNAIEFRDKVETKLISLWHNMKYGWNSKLRSNFNRESAIWFLGRCYHQKVTPNVSMQSSMHEPDNSKLLTTSLHEELPTSCDSYSQRYTETNCRSTNDLSRCDCKTDQAIEPPEETGQDVINEYEEGLDGFKRDFISKIWMTYRRDFAVMQADSKDLPTMSTNGYTSDCGWGCMIRSGQMLLANALIIHFLGRSWRFDPNSQITTSEDNVHRKIIRWFGDQKSKKSPFSIHKMVELGKKAGKKVGEWYGPGGVAHILKEAVKQAAKENTELTSLHVYVAQDCTIYNQDVYDECYFQEIQSTDSLERNKSKLSIDLRPSSKIKNIATWKHLIILIPLKLGQEKFLNTIYADCLKAMLSLEFCIGIIGGRPKHSLYFAGYQDDKLIHLDPHYCQDIVDVNNEWFSVSSFHCKTARKMKISKMDPSCCLGFYIPTRSEYDRFYATVQPYLQPVRNYSERHKISQSTSCLKPSNIMCDLTTYPMFTFQPGRLVDATIHPTSSFLDDDQLRDNDADDDGIEDFVIL